MSYKHYGLFLENVSILRFIAKDTLRNDEKVKCCQYELNESEMSSCEKIDAIVKDCVNFCLSEE